MIQVNDILLSKSGCFQTIFCLAGQENWSWEEVWAWKPVRSTKGKRWQAEKIDGSCEEPEFCGEDEL